MLHAKSDGVRIAVLAKAPIPGYAKTRLVPALGECGAAELQGHFIRRTLSIAVASGVGPVSLWCTPDSRHPFFQACAATYGVTLRNQVGEDLGERMLHAFQSPDQHSTILIGTDCPVLTPGHLRQCAERLLAGEDAVILPAQDGGYVLVGLRRPVPELFAGISWGTEHVMRQTRERLHHSALRWSEPCVLWDVDDTADLARLGQLTTDDVLAPARKSRAGHGLQDGCDDD